MAIAQKIVDALLGQQRTLPPKFSLGDEEADTEFAGRSPFVAWERALELGHHDPRLWARIKGSVYEPLYRKQFNPQD